MLLKWRVRRLGGTEVREGRKAAATNRGNDRRSIGPDAVAIRDVVRNECAGGGYSDVDVGATETSELPSTFDFFFGCTANCGADLAKSLAIES